MSLALLYQLVSRPEGAILSCLHLQVYHQGTSQFKGVSWAERSKKWRAQLWFGNKVQHLPLDAYAIPAQMTHCLCRHRTVKVLQHSCVHLGCCALASAQYSRLLV